MLQKLRQGWMRIFKTAQEAEQTRSAPILRPSVVQEDAREYELKKRVNKAFDDQWEQIQTRAMVRHGFKCDIFTCVGDQCPPWESDTIVEQVSDDKLEKSR